MTKSDKFFLFITGGIAGYICCFTVFALAWGLSYDITINDTIQGAFFCCTVGWMCPLLALCAIVCGGMGMLALVNICKDKSLLRRLWYTILTGLAAGLVSGVISIACSASFPAPCHSPKISPLILMICYVGAGLLCGIPAGIFCCFSGNSENPQPTQQPEQ